MKKKFITFILSIFTGLFIFAEEIHLQVKNEKLFIGPEDLRVESVIDSSSGKLAGVHLFIRKKGDIESVLLTETTKDPEGVRANYAYRAKEYNEINGDEIRYLDGKKLTSEFAKFSLIDSTVEKDPKFGKAFHVYIPSELVYGYPWSRNGEVTIAKGLFINIRAFSKKYADYTGEFYDNPYMFDFTELEKPKKEEPEEPPVEEPEKIPEPEVKEEKKEEPEVVLTDKYNPDAAESFKDIAQAANGKFTISEGPKNLTDDIMNLIDEIEPKENLDVVFCIDATGSMKDDFDELRKHWVPRLLESLKGFKKLRVGLLLYRDYGDSFKYKTLPVKFFDFTEDLKDFEKALNSFKIYGTEGFDIPEAVYEGLYASLDFYKWRNDAQKKIILIGDAEPHPTPRWSGKYTKDLVILTAREKKVTIDTIIVPDDKTKRGR